MIFPTPAQVGLPSKFKTWRKNQPRAIQDGLNSTKRFIIQVQRQGEGKSVTYMAQGLMDQNSRWSYLTSTKGLQKQLMDDFEGCGLVEIRGKATYDCEGLPGHTCDEGSISKCPYRGSGMCPHAEAKRLAGTERLVSSNYSCWIASNKYGQGWGKFDVMCCDEAHNAPGELAKAMEVLISEREVFEMLKREWPDHRSLSDMAAWKHWALVSRSMADKHLQRLKMEIQGHSGKPPVGLAKDVQRYTNLVRKLADIATCKPDTWVVDEWSYGYKFDPIDPAEYAERVLFRGIEKVFLDSGSIRPKTLEQLNIDPSECDFFDYPPDVNPARCPVIYIPTTKVNRYSQPWELRKLVARIDEIFESRADRKGIIHTSSFKIRDFIMSNSKYSRFMVSNYSQNGDLTSQVIERFKAIPAPALLVSPSVTTGFDFPYDACRYQIVAKLNFPYMASKIEEARRKIDPDRSSYHAILALQQAVGRGDRAPDDFQEVFILDDAFPVLKWRYESLFDPAFLMCVQTRTKVPPAPELAA